jgi:protein-S-isoprenylcysteine O-methyltransferase Ste14
VSLLAQHFAAHRIAWSRALVVVLLLLVLVTSPPKLGAGWVWELSEMVGFALLVAATLWRIWCHLFIAGTKDGELATEGPYSVVRNPLYLGNLTGIVGFGFAVEQPLLALVLGLVFAVAYPAVVAQEEARLGQIFGARYREYCARVPRWVPAWSRYREPASVSVSPRRMRGAILDAMWFLWAFALWEFIEELHALKLLPTLF